MCRAARLSIRLLLRTFLFAALLLPLACFGCGGVTLRKFDSFAFRALLSVTAQFSFLFARGSFRLRAFRDDPDGKPLPIERNAA